MEYKDNEAFGLIMSNKYILGLYKYCRESRRDFAYEGARKLDRCDKDIYQLLTMRNVKVISHCLLLDDVWLDDGLIGAKLYTIFLRQ